MVPELIRAIMKFVPDYFTWNEERQEEYRVHMPEEDEFNIRQFLMAELFGITVANDNEMDLVEIAPTAKPPVCRVMDHGKFIFEQKKKKAQEKKKQKQTQVKEVKLRPGTEEGDYQVKLRNLTRFLENGDKTKVTIRFRGREMAHRELGLDVLNRVAKDLEELANVEQRAKLEGRQMTMVLAPKSKK